MKGSILLPLVQILLIIVISTLICLGVYLYTFIDGYSPESSITFIQFINRIPQILLNIFPIVVLISIIISLVNTIKTPVNRGFAAFFTLITAGVIYYSGYTGLYHLNRISDYPKATSQNQLYNGKIHILRDSKLYLTESNGKVLAIDSKNISGIPELTIYRNGEYDTISKELHSGDGKSLLINPSNPFYSDIASPPHFFRMLINDLQVFNKSMKEIFEKSSWIFLATVLSQIAFAVGCWTIIRFSKWPFLNGLLAVGILRLFPLYYRISYSEVTQKAISFLKTSTATDLAPAALLLVAAIVLFLWDILFVKKGTVSSNG